MRIKFIKLFLILFVCFAYNSCNERFKGSGTVIAIQPFNDLPSELIVSVSDSLKKINANTILKPTIQLPRSTFNPERNRYRADKLIQYLKKFAYADTVIIGMTSQDISTTKNNHADWGVMGLGFCPGNACVVSSFRLTKTKLHAQFFKVAIHELGHTQGLPHCGNKTCYMRDAEGGNHLDEEIGFCNLCQNYLANKGWKFNSQSK